MLAHHQRRRFTPAEYLAIEEFSDSKSEYYDGELYAMSGASVEHNQLVRNLTVSLDPLLGMGPCQLFVADLRLHVESQNLFTYPDVFVVCGPLARLEGRNDTLVDATLIIEVLSPSTESYDRGQKFLFYQSLPSFREYLLVSQDVQQVELRTLQRPGQWLSTQFTEGTIRLESLNADLRLIDVYRNVDVPKLP